MRKKLQVMISLSRNEAKQLELLSEWFGCSKSMVVSMGLKELETVAVSMGLEPSYTKNLEKSVLNDTKTQPDVIPVSDTRVTQSKGVKS